MLATKRSKDIGKFRTASKLLLGDYLLSWVTCFLFLDARGREARAYYNYKHDVHLKYELRIIMIIIIYCVRYYLQAYTASGPRLKASNTYLHVSRSVSNPHRCRITAHKCSTKSGFCANAYTRTFVSYLVRHFKVEVEWLRYVRIQVWILAHRCTTANS